MNCSHEHKLEYPEREEGLAKFLFGKFTTSYTTSRVAFIIFFRSQPRNSDEMI